MIDDITPDSIKSIRKRYWLSQQGFARLLGIGEASMARYESGATPSKANANLIRAAMIPEFMAGCLERDGDTLSAKQRASVEKIVYAEITFDEEGDIMDMTDIYELTLQQEVLNETAWDVMAQISRARAAARANGDSALAMVYDDIEQQVARLVPAILSEESGNRDSLGEIRGQLIGFQKLLETQLAKAA